MDPQTPEDEAGDYFVSAFWALIMSGLFLALTAHPVIRKFDPGAIRTCWASCAFFILAALLFVVGSVTLRQGNRPPETHETGVAPKPEGK